MQEIDTCMIPFSYILSQDSNDGQPFSQKVRVNFINMHTMTILLVSYICRFVIHYNCAVGIQMYISHYFQYSAYNMFFRKKLLKCISFDSSVYGASALVENVHNLKPWQYITIFNQ